MWSLILASKSTRTVVSSGLLAGAVFIACRVHFTPLGNNPVLVADIVVREHARRALHGPGTQSHTLMDTGGQIGQLPQCIPGGNPLRMLPPKCCKLIVESLALLLVQMRNDGFDGVRHVEDPILLDKLQASKYRASSSSLKKKKAYLSNPNRE